MSIIAFFVAFYGTMLILFQQAEEISGNVIIGITLESLAAGVVMLIVCALIDLYVRDDNANDR